MYNRINVGKMGIRTGRTFQKKRQYLTGEFAKDMRDLRIKGRIRNPQTRIEADVDEPPQFVTYLTLALQNISDIIGVDLSKMRSVGAVERALGNSGKLWEVASFLWLHKDDMPKRNYDKANSADGNEPDYVKYTKAITVKLWEFRNMFVHSTAPQAAKVLVVDRAFYQFAEGELYAEALGHAMGAGRKTEKTFKLRLFNPHDDSRLKYEFTRKGMIFLVCLALYRHDAMEFIQQFKDLRLAPKDWELKHGLVENCTEKELGDLRRKGGSNKAIIDAFSYYSMRSSRTDIDVMNVRYLNFANILTYLNKVPLDSYNYLALKGESDKLILEAQKSAESEANKRFKYLLHPRQKDRFLSLALAYIEDFKKLECIRFKRLDVTVRPERSRYMFGPIPEGSKNEFGEEISDANGMDRHYAIVDGKAEFEYVPQNDEHYGAIRIARLRGSISEDEIMRLMLAMFMRSQGNTEIKDPNDVLKEYLKNYHRILERMLNAEDAGAFSLENPDFKNDFKRVSGKGRDVLDKNVFVDAMKPFFPSGITRYFTGDGMELGTAGLQNALSSKLQAMCDHASDFLKRMDCLTDWLRLDREARLKLGTPKCKIGELKYPPRTCRVTDAQLIKWVMAYVNLNLTSKEDKYRQLPRGLRHRGVRDFEYQLLHRDIGRFGANPVGLWKTLEKREVLNGEDGPLEALKAHEQELFRDEQRRCRGKFDKNGRPLRVGHTLTMLAYAAAELYIDTCEQLRGVWCGNLEDEDKELLPFICRMYGVRTGMPLDRKSLVKTILGIDLETWSMAYDYENNAPRSEPRRLEDAKNLIVSQIPVPNQLAIRCMPASQEGGKFLFNPAFRDFNPYENGRMALRGYYDVSPLIEYVRVHDRFEEKVDVSAAGVETRGGQEAAEGEYGKLPPKNAAGFSRNDVNRAIQKILLCERQDKILLACAKDYWNAYMNDEVKTSLKDKVSGFEFAECADIGQFFTKSIDDSVDGVKIRMMPNDFARPVYSVIVEHLKELLPDVSPIPGTDGVYALYDLNLALKDLQRKENSLRIKYLPAVVKFEMLGNEPQEKLPGGIDALFEHYRKELSSVSEIPLTREEFDAVLSLRNRLVHPIQKQDGARGLVDADRDVALVTLRRFGCLGIEK